MTRSSEGSSGGSSSHVVFIGGIVVPIRISNEAREESRTMGWRRPAKRFFPSPDSLLDSSETHSNQYTQYKAYRPFPVSSEAISIVQDSKIVKFSFDLSSRFFRSTTSPYTSTHSLRSNVLWLLCFAGIERDPSRFSETFSRFLRKSPSRAVW
jgi:hypothetical protein